MIKDMIFVVLTTDPIRDTKKANNKLKIRLIIC